MDERSNPSPGGAVGRGGPGGPRVTVYWRPGCVYCARLRVGLRRAGIEYEPVDIWQVPEAAAAVRAVTGGSETVPTVVIGDTAMVNPTARQVRAALDAAGVEGRGRQRHAGPLGRLLRRRP